MKMTGQTRLTAIVLGLSTMAPLEARAANVSLSWLADSVYVPNVVGDTTCQYGDFDCNPCVADVRGEFSRFKNSGRDDRTYFFRNDDRFPPYGIRGSTVTTDLLSTADGHVQSFIRLPIDGGGTDWWYASTHSESSGPGYLSFMSHDMCGRTGGTRYVYPLNLSNHPGGMQSVGSLLVVAHEDDSRGYYEVLETSLPSGVHRTGTVELPSKQAANVAAARLKEGGFVFVSSRDSLQKHYDFYYATELENLAGFRGVGDGTASERAENLSMITECGTGSLYVIGATAEWQGPQNGGGPFYFDNLWSLYQLVKDGEKIRMQFVTDVEKDRSNSCNARASGTFFVDNEHHLHAYCHEKLLGDAGNRLEAGSIGYGEYWWNKGTHECAPGSGGGGPEYPVDPN